MLKKISAVLATLSMIMVGLSVSPASATTYSANENSTANKLVYSGTQAANGDFSIPVTGIKHANLVQRWVWKGTKLSDVMNKTIKVNLTLTRPNGTPVANIISSPNFSYYEYAVLFHANSQNQDPAVTLPVGVTETTITPVSGTTYDRLHIDVYSGLQNEDGSDLAVGTYRLTYQVLVDGVPYSGFQATPAADTAYTEANSVSAEQPWAITKTRDIQYGLFDSVSVSTLTCLNTSLVSSGDALTIRRLTDGNLGQSVATSYVNVYTGGSGIGSYDSSTPLSVNSGMLSIRTQFSSEPRIYNTSSTNASANAANKVAAGVHTFEISVAKANGTEVSGACLVPATTTPTAQLNQTTVNASVGGYSDSAKMACQAYDSTTNLPVGDLTPVNWVTSFGNNQCIPGAVPPGSTVYVKFLTWSETFPGWITYSAASNTVTIPGLGINLTSTASNGTSFGQVKDLGLIDESRVGNRQHSYVQVTDPSGGFWEVASMANAANTSSTYKIRRYKATGLDSNFSSSEFSTGSGFSVGASFGWHGTLAAPKFTMATVDPSGTPALTVRDFSVGGAQGDIRTVTKSDLDGICSNASAFGAGYTLSASERLASVLSAPSSDVWLQIACSSSNNANPPVTKTGYLVIRLNISNTNAPTIVTNLGVPTDALNKFHTGGSMAGMTGVDHTTNFAATGSAPMFTFLSIAMNQNWSNFQAPYTYGAAKVYRITSAGVVTSTDAGLTLPSGASNTQVTPNMDEQNFGTSIFVINTSSMGQGAPTETMYKLGATGGLTPFTLVMDNNADYPVLQNAQDNLYRTVGITSDGQVVMIRWRGTYSQQNGNSTILALAKVNLTTGVVTTFGEAIKFNQPSWNGYSNTVPMGGNSLGFIAQDLSHQGKVIFQYIAGGDLATNGGGGGSVPVPVGDGTAELGHSINSGGTTFTLTGTGLNLVTEVWVGGVKATIKTKADGTITVQVPAGTSSSAPVVFKYNGGEVTAGIWNYVGAVKVSQNVTVNVGGNLANYGEPDRTLSASSVNSANNSALSVTFDFTTTTPKVCVVVNVNKLHLLSSGVCTVKTSQAGNAWLAKSADVLTNITVIKATQSWSTSPATTLSITDATPGRIVASLDNNESVLEFTSLNPTICDVDADGTVTGFVAGTCTVTVGQAGDSRFSPIAPVSVTVTITADTNPIADFATTENDSVGPKPIPSGAAGSFVSTNDPSFQLSWNSATGKLIPRATGIYLGNIDAKVEFTKNGVNYACVMTFGNLTKMPVKTAAQKKAAKAAKVFSTTTAFCTDAKKLSIPASLDGKANFAKLKSVPKTTAEKAAEKISFGALKGFTGTVTITVTRYRAWWSTLLNVTGDKGNGKKIKATKRVTVVTLG